MQARFDTLPHYSSNQMGWIFVMFHMSSIPFPLLALLRMWNYLLLQHQLKLFKFKGQEFDSSVRRNSPCNIWYYIYHKVGIESFNAGTRTNIINKYFLLFILVCCRRGTKKSDFLCCFSFYMYEFSVVSYFDLHSPLHSHTKTHIGQKQRAKVSCHFFKYFTLKQFTLRHIQYIVLMYMVFDDTLSVRLSLSY